MIRPLNRRATRRQRVLGRIALTVTLTVTAGIGTAAGAAGAEPRGASTDAVVVSPGARFVPRATIVLKARETGFLTAQEGDDRLRWIDYATGATTVLDHRLPEPLAYDVDEFRFAQYPADFGHGSDTVALYAESPTPHVTLQQRAGGGASSTVPIPEGQTYVATYGDTVITRTGTEKAATGLHLLRLENGEVRDRRLEGLPEGWNLSISEGDARSVAVRGIKWEDTTMSQGWWVVDLATGSVKALATQGESVSFDRDTVLHVGAPSSDAAQVYRRDDLDAEPTTVDLRDVASYDDVVRRLGDGFVTVTPPSPGNEGGYRGNHLVLRDAMGSWESLLAVATPSVHRTPDGSLVVAGAEEKTSYGALDWGYYLFTPAADGTVTRKRLADIEDREAKPAGISLGSGILTTADDSKHYDPATTIGGYRSTWLKTSGRPEELNSTVKVSAKADGGIWPTTSTIVPFGDPVGDGGNDTLVTDKDGYLYRYSPERGKVVTPDAPHTKIGSGWKSFDGLTYSGDLTSDGIPDLVARQTATGDLYLYAGTKTGGFTRTGRIGTSWKNMTIVGAGDLNADKHADLVARATNGDLYRYYGTGKGTISSGTKIGSGWGGMADFVGIGDLTGDGKDDILGRTKTGYLYRYAGNGTGGIGSGVQVGTGWKSFTSVR